MIELAAEILFQLVLAMAVGVLLGWLWWGRRGQVGEDATEQASASASLTATEDASTDGPAERARATAVAERDELARRIKAERASKDKKVSELRRQLDETRAELDAVGRRSAEDGAAADADPSDALATARLLERLRRDKQRLVSALEEARHSNDLLLSQLARTRRELRDGEQLSTRLVRAEADLLELRSQRNERIALERATAEDASSDDHLDNVIVLDGGAQPLRIPTLDPDLSQTAN